MPSITSGAVAAALSILALQTPRHQVEYVVDKWWFGKVALDYLATKSVDDRVQAAPAPTVIEGVVLCVFDELPDPAS